jgi:guanylate kinase
VSLTTRKPRPGEVDGVHYHFVDDSTFDEMIAGHGFVEWAHVYGHRSGTPRGPIEAWLAEGRDVLVEGDPQGALAFKAAYPTSVVVFLRAPDLESQRERLVARGTTGADLERRLALSERQIAEAASFDAVVVNDDIDETISQVERLFSLSEQDPEQRTDPN